MIVALGTSTPTSINEVASSTWSSRARNARMTSSFSLGRSRPCRQSDAERRQRLLQALEFLRDGFDPVGAGFLNPRIDDIRLPALRQPVADERPHLRQLIRRAHKGLDAPAARRQFVNDGHVQLAIDRQTQRARDGRRGHHQQMRIMALAHEFLALRHAELVLLVNDHQTKVSRRKPRFDQRVGADGEGRRAALDSAFRIPAPPCA